MQALYCAGEEELVQEFTMTGLLPDTEEFITYEGSLTQPPCQVLSRTSLHVLVP
jgi:carbonic anhydrase